MFAEKGDILHEEGAAGAQASADWVFPKPLDAFQGKRVIGIKYDLLRVPQPADPVKAIQRPVRKSPPKAEVEEEKPKPEVPRFQVTVRSVVTMEDEREVEAATARQAGETALGLVAREKGEPAAVKLSRKVVRVRRL